MENLKFKDYYDKVLGCYLGKTIGGTLGAPFECYRGLYDLKWFMQDISKPVPNDDVDLQLIWLRMIELEGAKIDSHTLAEYWNTYICATLAEYGTGKSNFNMGIVPPLSGAMHNGLHNSNGAWIRSEIWACLCAGNPGLAANYAYYDSSVDHTGEGVYAAVFIAALQAAAFFEKDLFKLIDIALSYIPKTSGVGKAVQVVLKDYADKKGYPEVRKDLFKAVPSNFGEMCGYWKGTKEVPACKEAPVQEEEKDIPVSEHGYDAPWSVGAVLTGLLYGKLDLGRTVCIAADLGEDTDCTAGTAGSILGIILGASALDPKWKKACSDEIATCTLRIDSNLALPKSFEELVYRICLQTPRVLGNSHCKLFSFAPETPFEAGMKENYYEIVPVASFAYAKGQFPEYWQEDSGVLLSEVGTTVRRHFPFYTVLMKYDASLAHISPSETKTLEVSFHNMLFTPQYLTIRLLDMPADLTCDYGNEFCVGLEHFHNNDNTNSITLHFHAADVLHQGRLCFVMEISTFGRMSKNYIPITFINGRC